jgi:hypothetical protein
MKRFTFNCSRSAEANIAFVLNFLEYQTLIVAALFIISSERAFIGAKFPDEKFRHYTMKSFMAIYQSRLCRYRINDNKPMF